MPGTEENPVPVEVKKFAFPDWVKLMIGGGFAVVVGYLLVQNMMKRGEGTDAFIQQGMFQMAKDSSAAMTKAADSLDDLTTSLDGLVSQQQQLVEDLSPLTRQLDRVADAVRERVVQEQQEHDDEAAEADEP